MENGGVKMKDVMIDLETLGLSANCVVLSIGATFFDIENNTLGETFYKVLNLSDQIDKGRVVDSVALTWWLEQDPKLFQPLLKGNCSTYTALQEFTQYIQLNGGPNVNVWGNGAIFDINILENLILQNDRRVPWKFRNIMDFRTFKRFGAPANVFNQHKHNALEDARSQALYVIESINGDNL